MTGIERRVDRLENAAGGRQGTTWLLRPGAEGTFLTSTGETLTDRDVDMLAAGGDLCLILWPGGLEARGAAGGLAPVADLVRQFGECPELADRLAGLDDE